MTDQYTEDALERGRPTGDCDCEACACPLHTYEDDNRCIWCQNSQHASEDSGVVYVDFRPVEGHAEESQAVRDVLAVELVNPATADDYDRGELVLHQHDGTSVFDRNEMRGFRAKGGVRVPEYEQDEVEDGA